MKIVIDIPTHIYRQAVIKADQQGTTLKEFFVNILSREVQDYTFPSGEMPWKLLVGKGSASNLEPGTSGFDDYVGPTLL
jgi:hypothetical protein